MSKKEEQLARMRGLMTYGIGNTQKKTPITESFDCPDGKIYAIIREGSKYYIKSANKGSELVAESFNYIGGFMNRKNNEFSSYNQASKNLELKIRSINESYGLNKSVELLNPDKKEELMVEMTSAMKDSIARYREIISNTSKLMNENSNISSTNVGVPEAPKTTKFTPSIGEPFENKAEAKLDKDLNVKSKNPEKQGEPFGEEAKTEEYEDAKFVPNNSVANQHPSGGKVVKVNESNDYDVYEEECDENDPFCEDLIDEENEDVVGFNDDDNSLGEGEEDEDIDIDDIDIDLESEEEGVEDDIELDDLDSEENEEEIENTEDVEDTESIDDVNDIEVSENDEIETLKKEIENLKSIVAELSAKNNEEDAEIELEMDDDFDNEDGEFEDDDFEDEEFEDEEFGDEDFEDEDDLDSINEEKLNVFGKHPGYRKKPMNLPSTGVDSYDGNKDWNDESVYSEQPFGSKIGSSSPYETIINKSVETVLESLKKKL